MPEISTEELKEICALTVELTRIRQRGCEHLCVENFSPELFHDLLSKLALVKNGIRGGEFWAK